jgi:hypothetical protein
MVWKGVLNAEEEACLLVLDVLKANHVALVKTLNFSTYKKLELNSIGLILKLQLSCNKGNHVF